jgi:hypothetical protein
MTTEAEINALPIAQAVALLRGHIVSSRLKDGDVNFATSLANAFDRNGTLSTSQAYWVRRLLLKVAGNGAPAKDYGTYAVIAAEFQRLFDQGKKLPKLMFRVEGEYRSDYMDTVCKVKTFGKITPNKRREVLYVTVNGGWYATLRMDGTLLKAKGVRDNMPIWNFMLAELKILNRDPHGYAKRFAETGCCCYCCKPLEDKPSVEAGYGPQCAKTWGRPWGGKTAEQRITRPKKAAAKLDGDADQTFW